MLKSSEERRSWEHSVILDQTLLFAFLHFPNDKYLLPDLKWTSQHMIETPRHHHSRWCRGFQTPRTAPQTDVDVVWVQSEGRVSYKLSLTKWEILIRLLAPSYYHLMETPKRQVRWAELVLLEKRLYRDAAPTMSDWVTKELWLFSFLLFFINSFIS